jgi:hypothetical protein
VALPIILGRDLLVAWFADNADHVIGDRAKDPLDLGRTQALCAEREDRIKERMDHMGAGIRL